jgi:hypothetical protein
MLSTRLSARGVRIILPLTMVLLTVACVAIGDRLYGHFLLNETANLLYPSHSRATHISTEFDLSIRINNLGFRGPDVRIEKRRKRVMIIGDSFTFGWGVEEHETWVNLLQEEFPEVEILNLGKGGSHPGNHVQLMREVMPMLKPDIVIEAVLQGNDLNQLMGEIAYERGERVSPFAPMVASLKVTDIREPDESLNQRVARRLLPNISKKYLRTANVRTRWLAEAEALQRSFNSDIQLRFNSLDEEIQNALKDGLLNPWLMFEAMYFPRAIHHAADTTFPLLHDAMVRLSHYMIQMDDICTENGADLMVVSLPNRPYGCQDCVADLRRLGFDANGSDTLNGDAAVRWSIVASRVKTVPAAEVMGRDCYFPLDGHWNARGHRLFAQGLIPQLREVLRPE